MRLASFAVMFVLAVAVLLGCEDKANNQGNSKSNNPQATTQPETTAPPVYNDTSLAPPVGRTPEVPPVSEDETIAPSPEPLMPTPPVTTAPEP